MDIVSEMIARAAQIEREKNGKALTKDEADALKAVAFLRKIAPYAFPDGAK